MLPMLHLDDELYEEILKQAKNKISLYCPEWTDYNEHDPGITLLELFCWLKESQQFYMDHMDNSMQSKFLQLLGLCCRHNCPASGWLVLKSSAPAKLLRGTPFYAEKLCLILKETSWNSGISIASMTAADNIICNLQEIKSNRLRFFPFGKNPTENDTWKIIFEKSLSKIQQLTLYISVFEKYPIRRNPPQEGYPNLAEWKAEVLIDNDWAPCEIMADGTNALIVSGQICLKLPHKKNIDAIRFKLSAEVSYDVPPLITDIQTDVFAVEQLEQKAVCIRMTADNVNTEIFELPLTYPLVNWETEYFVKDEIGYLPVTPNEITQTEEYINIKINSEFPITELLAVVWDKDNISLLNPGMGSGFPYQEFDLHCNDLHYSSFEIIIYDPYDKHWHLWKKTDNIYESGRLDRVYQLDEKNGRLIFGNGENGRMPDGDLRIISLAFTYAEAGNIKGGKISNSSVSKELWRNAVYQNLTGGASLETPAESLARGRHEKAIPDRAVTIEDYIKLVYAAPGLMIKNCHVSSGSSKQNFVNIAVEPYTGTEKADANPAYLKVLERLLEPRRLIGTGISISFPKYVDIHLYVDLNIYIYDTGSETRIRNALEHLFHTEYHEFGKTILYSAVYAAIDLMPEVRQIQNLVMQCRSDFVKISRNGDLFLPENGLPYLSHLELKLISIN